jgi:hypothetical protein
LQSGKKTKRASGSSSEPKKISCTLSLLQIRHCSGHGSPQIPIPRFKKNLIKQDHTFSNVYLQSWPHGNFLSHGSLHGPRLHGSEHRRVHCKCLHL